MESQLGKIQEENWDLAWNSGLYLDLMSVDFIVLKEENGATYPRPVHCKTKEKERM